MTVAAPGGDPLGSTMPLVFQSLAHGQGQGPDKKPKSGGNVNGPARKNVSDFL